ncbi:MAG: hypothetical protein HY360_20960 [Verrucomicrobia bacterium]|nr:hypothetical protein [Verrucomicrobiota bacterium]
MRHIWICMIDGCLVRAGAVQPGDTMPLLLERLLKVFPHMQPEALKIVCEDGRIFDNELWFANPTLRDPQAQTPDNLLVAVGVVDGHVGVKVHHGLTAEQILEAEASTFSGRINDNMDFGVYDFSGEQHASIEDMIALVESETPPPSAEPTQHRNRPRKARRFPPRRRVRRVASSVGPESEPRSSAGKTPAASPAAPPETSPAGGSSDPPSHPPSDPGGA